MRKGSILAGVIGPPTIPVGGREVWRRKGGGLGHDALRRAKVWLASALGEPLFHFVLIGAVLFAVFDAHRGLARDHEIVLDPARVNKFTADYRAEFGQAPTAIELRSLARRYVQDEILYREGLALGLERDDEIVRRRVVQKMQFIEQDRDASSDVTPDQLQAYYNEHRDRYATPERVSFSHIFFGLDHGDAAARSRALAVLAGLGGAGPTRAPALGDRFSDLYDYDQLDADGARRLFGPTNIAAALSKAPVGRWSGPYRSVYGWHLVYVSARTPAATPALTQVADRVRGDLVEDQQTAANETALAALRRRYRVVGSDAGLAAP